MQQNARAYVPRQDLKADIADPLRAVFNAPDEQEAKRLLESFVVRHTKTVPKLAAWAKQNIPEGLAVFQMTKPHQRRLRTIDPLERVNREIDRRTHVANVAARADSIENFGSMWFAVGNAIIRP